MKHGACFYTQGRRLGPPVEPACGGPPPNTNVFVDSLGPGFVLLTEGNILNPCYVILPYLLHGAESFLRS